MGGFFGGFGGCNGNQSIDYCTLLLLLFIITQCGCNDITWIILLLLLTGCGHNNTNCR